MSPRTNTTARTLRRVVTIVLAALAITAVTLVVAHPSAPTPHPPATQELLMPRGYDPYYRIPAPTPEARPAPHADGR